MKEWINYTWASLLILFGSALLIWIGYNLLVEMQPVAEGRNPVTPTIFAIAMIVVGVLRLRRQTRSA